MTARAERARFSLISIALLALMTVTVPAVAQVSDADPAYDPQRSIARNWNELLLYAIRRDFARPTVHARNLFHLSTAMYDVWAAHDTTASPYFLGRTQRNGEQCAFSDVQAAFFREGLSDSARADSVEVAISYTMYRLLRQRFEKSPGRDSVYRRSDEFMLALDLDADIESTDLDAERTAAVLGNHIAACVIRQGGKDGANEANGFGNLFYQPINAPLDPTMSGNPGLSNPNRWQPLELNIFVDQSGNTTGTPFFLGAEWSEVQTFSLTPADITWILRDDQSQPVYLDPGMPALLGDDPARNTDYLEGHSLVALWSAHLDPGDGILWDISPGSLGKSGALPHEPAAINAYYDRLNGGRAENSGNVTESSVDQSSGTEDPSAGVAASGSAARGHALNPATGQPYARQVVPRGDYTRVLAEFWADGPDSETPPGHWFRIYNDAVSDHPDFERRVEGAGPLLDPLAFDVRAYFLLGAAMHDSAVAAWSTKGAYDYVRPLSAIRYMAGQGQSTDPAGARYSVQGVPLEPGRIEAVAAGDPLAGNGGANIGKIKVRAWRGPDFIGNSDSDTAGVGWILMENWWPYQRPTFVTPPFAGYVSGHSTFSRAAAEILTVLTGDEFFPGGLAEFTAGRNEFLVFEEGPSVDVVLQWATYRDASDQTSLSRIWGGIHPPIDDLPGRLMGVRVSEKVRERAALFFAGTAPLSDVDASSMGNGGSRQRNAGNGCSMAGNAHRSDPLFALVLISVVSWRYRRRAGGANTVVGE